MDLNFTKGQGVVGLFDGDLVCYLSTAVNVLERFSRMVMYLSTKVSSSVNFSVVNSVTTAISSVPDTDHLDVVGFAEVYSPPVVRSLIVFGVGTRFVSIKVSGSVPIDSFSRIRSTALRSSLGWLSTREKRSICHRQYNEQNNKQLHHVWRKWENDVLSSCVWDFIVPLVANSIVVHFLYEDFLWLKVFCGSFTTVKKTDTIFIHHPL